MASGARVESIEALRAFRTAWIKFGEAVTLALQDAESEMQRTLVWLETEAPTYWAGQIRKRQEAVSRAKEALRQKQMYKDFSGRTPSAVDEQKALALAMKRLEEAEEKLAAVKKYARRLAREIDLYKGSVQRLATSAMSDIPLAASRIDRMVATLEQYVALAPAGEAPAAEAAGAGAAESEVGPRLSPWCRLRRSTPRPDVRAAAARAALPATDWKIAIVGPAHREALAYLPLEKQPPQPSQWMVLNAAAITAASVYFERLPAQFPDDSGWYVGPADDSEPHELWCISIESLLAARPDLRPVLELPVGVLVVMDASGVAAVLDARAEDLWPAALYKVTGARMGDAAATVPQASSAGAGGNASAPGQTEAQ